MLKHSETCNLVGGALTDEQIMKVWDEVEPQRDPSGHKFALVFARAILALATPIAAQPAAPKCEPGCFYYGTRLDCETCNPEAFPPAAPAQAAAMCKDCGRPDYPQGINAQGICFDCMYAAPLKHNPASTQRKWPKGLFSGVRQMDRHIASLLREAADMLGYIGGSPEGIDATVRQAEDLMVRIEKALNSEAAPAQAAAVPEAVLKEAFREGFYSVETYNDVLQNDSDAAWLKSDTRKAGASDKGETTNDE